MKGSRSIDRILLAILPPLAYGLIRLLGWTMRLTYIDFEGVNRLWEEGRNAIIAFWHGRLLMMPIVYKGKGISILVSQHRDGELIARTVKRFGMDSVRGSTTRGWLLGVKGLLEAIKDKRDIAITPDGPRGPRFQVQMGIIQIARTTGLPIIPMAFGASKKKPLIAGTGLSYPIHFPEGCLYAEGLSI